MVSSPTAFKKRSFSDVNSNIEGASPVLHDLSGQPLCRETLSAALTSRVKSIDVVAGSEKLWPQSHSAKLRVVFEEGAEKIVYLKKVIGADLPPKPLDGLRRDVLSNRNEARFYAEFAEELSSRGVRLMRPLHVQHRFEALERQHLAPTEEESALRDVGFLIVMESAEGYLQTSPLSFDQAMLSVSLLVDFHASAWQDCNFLQRVSRRLQSIAGYWALHHRGGEDLRQMCATWQRYLEEFKDLAPDGLLTRPEIVRLGERLESVVHRVSKELAASPESPFATVVHGDFKAMNVFLPAYDRDGHEVATGAIPIDFQWTGLGFGMADVAMHLSHSVHPDALCNGGEAQLVKHYHTALRAKLGACSESYTLDVAWRHYRLAVIDYARMVFSVFFKGASPTVFAARAEKENVGMIYRNLEASFMFIERVDASLSFVEREIQP